MERFALDKHSAIQQRKACSAVAGFEIPLTGSNLVSMVMAMRHYDRRYLMQTMHRVRSKYNESKLERYIIVVLPPVDHMKYLIALTLHGSSKEQSEVKSDIVKWFGYRPKNQLKKWNDWIPSDDRHEEEEMNYDGPGDKPVGFYTVDEIADEEKALEQYYKDLTHA